MGHTSDGTVQIEQKLVQRNVQTGVTSYHDSQKSDERTAGPQITLTLTDGFWTDVDAQLILQELRHRQGETTHARSHPNQASLTDSRLTDLEAQLILQELRRKQWEFTCYSHWTVSEEERQLTYARAHRNQVSLTDMRLTDMQAHGILQDLRQRQSETIHQNPRKRELSAPNQVSLTDVRLTDVEAHMILEGFRQRGSTGSLTDACLRKDEAQLLFERARGRRGGTTAFRKEQKVEVDEGAGACASAAVGACAAANASAGAIASDAIASRARLHRLQIRQRFEGKEHHDEFSEWQTIEEWFETETSLCRQFTSLQIV